MSLKKNLLFFCLISMMLFLLSCNQKTSNTNIKETVVETTSQNISNDTSHAIIETYPPITKQNEENVIRETSFENNNIDNKENSGRVLTEATSESINEIVNETENETANETAKETPIPEPENDGEVYKEISDEMENFSYDSTQIGLCIYDLSDEFMINYSDAIKNKLEEKGYKVIIVDARNEQSIQNEQIDEFINQEIDGLIINPVMTSSSEVLIEKVRNANIPTVLINREPTDDQMSLYNRLAYVGSDARQSGAMQGDIIYALPNHGDINGDDVVKYVMIEGDPENIDSQFRTEYSVKSLTDKGIDTECLLSQQGMWEREKGKQICENALAKFGNDIEVIFSNNDDMALGALEALNDLGMKVNEDVYLVGVDALDDAILEIIDGNMTGTVFNDYNAQADTTIATLEELLDGQTFEPGEQSIYVDYVKVTKDNASKFR